MESASSEKKLSDSLLAHPVEVPKDLDGGDVLDWVEIDWDKSESRDNDIDLRFDEHNNDRICTTPEVKDLRKVRNTLSKFLELLLTLTL